MILYNIKFLRKQINLQFSFDWYGVKWSNILSSPQTPLLSLKTLEG